MTGDGWCPRRMKVSPENTYPGEHATSISDAGARRRLYNLNRGPYLLLGRRKDQACLKNVTPRQR